MNFIYIALYIYIIYHKYNNKYDNIWNIISYIIINNEIHKNTCKASKIFSFKIHSNIIYFN